MSVTPTTQQKRAKHAWDTVEAARTKTGWEEFDGNVKRLGPRIINAGLGPAIAFASAKEGGALVSHLSAWVLHKGNQGESGPDLQQRIREGNSDELRRWTAEALEWLIWVKRFCEAESNARKAGDDKAAR